MLPLRRFESERKSQKNSRARVPKGPNFPMKNLKCSELGEWAAVQDIGIVAPIFAVLFIVVLGCMFCKINYSEDYENMDKFLATGGDKTNAEAYSKYIEARKRKFNAMIVAALAIVIAAYIAFIAFGI